MTISMLYLTRVSFFTCIADNFGEKIRATLSFCKIAGNWKQRDLPNPGGIHMHTFFDPIILS